MLLSQIREYLKTQIDCPQYYLNKMGGSQDKSITIYNAPGQVPHIAIGGLENTPYTTKSISFLIPWGKNSDEAEKKAMEVYNLFFGQSNFTIGDKKIIQCKMRSSEPIYLGTDSEGIIEYIIDTTIYYER